VASPVLVDGHNPRSPACPASRFASPAVGSATMTTSGPFPLAEDEVLLLDGGSATTLEARGHDLAGPL
jgi:hypothetical protein